MTTYYIEDKYGEYASIDGTRKFKKMSGKEAYEYLKTPEGKKKRFITTVDTDNNKKIFIELREDDITDYRKAERREQYQRECESKYGYTTLTLLSCIDDDEESGYPCEESIADEQEDIENDYMHREEIKTLRNAIDSLEPNERDLIFAFFL